MHSHGIFLARRRQANETTRCNDLFSAESRQTIHRRARHVQGHHAAAPKNPVRHCRCNPPGRNELPGAIERIGSEKWPGTQHHVRPESFVARLESLVRGIETSSILAEKRT